MPPSSGALGLSRHSFANKHTGPDKKLQTAKNELDVTETTRAPLKSGTVLLIPPQIFHRHLVRERIGLITAFCDTGAASCSPVIQF